MELYLLILLLIVAIGIAVYFALKYLAVAHRDKVPGVDFSHFRKQ